MDFNEFKKKINDFNNLNIVNTVPEAKYIDKTKGNTYELDQFNWTMKCRNYRQDVRNELKGFKKKKFKVIDSLDMVQTLMLEQDFGVKWSKLTKKNKLIKIGEYLENLDIKKEYRKKIKIFTYTGFNKGILKNSKTVNYDKLNYKIIEIPLIIEKIKLFNKNGL